MSLIADIFSTFLKHKCHRIRRRQTNSQLVISSGLVKLSLMLLSSLKMSSKIFSIFITHEDRYGGSVALRAHHTQVLALVLGSEFANH